MTLSGALNHEYSVCCNLYSGEVPDETTGANTAEYVGSTTREAVRLAAGRKPVLPVAWLQHDNNWDHSINKTAPRQLLAPEHEAIELKTPLENGAAGVLIWGHLDSPRRASAPTMRTAGTFYVVFVVVVFGLFCGVEHLRRIRLLHEPYRSLPSIFAERPTKGAPTIHKESHIVLSCLV